MNVRLKTTITTLLLSMFILCHAGGSYTKQDSVIYSKYIAEFSEYRDKPINELVILTGKYFLGKPYVASTLENNGEERLIVNLREFDCTTFVENSIALSKELKKGDQHSFEGFMEALKLMRYRAGKIDGYTSRIHYTSDWVYENKNLFENITLQLGGTVVDKPLSFMSANYHLYAALENSRSNRAETKLTEQNINKRNNYTLLPLSKIEQTANNIKTGDIIIFATKVKGLDYSHIGFAFWEGKILKLLHASSAGKRVVIDSKTLVQYVKTSRTATGITVLRLTTNNEE